MEKFFKLKENGTTVRIELMAGLTTFMTMAYIIALNPTLISGAFSGAFSADFSADFSAGLSAGLRSPGLPGAGTLIDTRRSRSGPTASADRGR